MYFIEYGTYREGVQAGRIEIYQINDKGEIAGDIEKDKQESNTIVLPIEIWRRLRNKLDSFDF